MRIVVDLDGTICPVRKDGESYSELLPYEGAAEKLKGLRKEGHYIIIQTARNMATCDSNLGKVIKNIGLVTLEWLKKYDIEYDEVYFGKPNGEVYIDDRAFRFNGWDEITGEGLVKIGKAK